MANVTLQQAISDDGERTITFTHDEVSNVSTLPALHITATVSNYAVYGTTSVVMGGPSQWFTVSDGTNTWLIPGYLV